MADLPPRQARFVLEYLIDLNATQAAIRAGYSAKTAQEQSSRLLSNVMVAEAVQAGQERLAHKIEITAAKVIGELAKIGFANMADYMRATPGGDPYLDFSGLSRDQAAALQEVTVEDFTDGRGDDARDVRRVKFKLGDKRAALVDLGRHLGIFTDNLNMNATVKTVSAEPLTDDEWERRHGDNLAPTAGAPKGAG